MRARASDSGRNWSTRRTSTSPRGMTSIRVRSKPRSPHQAMRVSNSSSLTPLRATVLILTSSPAAVAASMPSSTRSSWPQRVTAAKRRASRVSRETLTRRTPQSARSDAYLASRLPLVVSVSSSRPPRSRWRDRLRNKAMMSRLTSGSPPVRRNLRTPLSIKALHRRSSSSRLSSSALGRKVISSAMQYWQRKSQRSVTETRR